MIMGNDMQEMSQQVQVPEASSLLERVVHLGARVVETVRNFYINFRAKFVYTEHVQETIRHRYDEKPQQITSTQLSQEMDAQVVALMNEVFGGQHPGEYLVSIHSLEQRQAVMEEFATRLLKLYGLTDIKFISDYDSMSICGYYDFGPRVLFLNKSFLLIDNPTILLDAVDTILHESRHAVQHAAMYDHNPLGFDNETIISWVKNRKNYIRNDPKAYREQPVEADAFSFAANIIHTYFQNNGIKV